jgi:NitT/TauT family transport system permease protein
LKSTQKTTRKFDSLILLAVFVGFWSLLNATYGSNAIASPVQAIERLVRLAVHGNLLGHMAETFSAYAYALVLAIIGGTLAGMLLGLHKMAGDVGEPILVSIYSLPKVTLYPVVLLIFGLGMSAKVAFGFLHGVLPIAIFTIGAIRQIPKIYLKASQTLQVPHQKYIRYVVVPATLPEYFSGVKIGVSLTLLGVLIGEMFGSQRGLGYLLMKGIELNDTSLMAAVALVLLTVAILIGVSLQRIDHHLRR